MTGKITGALREQSDWAQNDENRLGFIKNKPFYDTRKSKSLTIEWDGEIGDKPTFSDMYARISDATPTYEEIANGSYTISNIEETERQFEGLIDESDNGMPLLMEMVDGTPWIVFILETVEQEGVTFLPGIYAIKNEGLWISKIHFPSVATGELKTIDPKYLPSSGGTPIINLDEYVGYVNDLQMRLPISQVVGYLIQNPSAVAFAISDINNNDLFGKLKETEVIVQLAASERANVRVRTLKCIFGAQAENGKPFVEHTFAVPMSLNGSNVKTYFVRLLDYSDGKLQVWLDCVIE